MLGMTGDNLGTLERQYEKNGAQAVAKLRYETETNKLLLFPFPPPGP